MTSPASSRRAAPAARVSGAEVRLVALAAVTAIAFYTCWLLARPFLGPLTWAGVLALVTFPAYSWIARRVPRPSIAAALAVAAVTLALLLPLTGAGFAIAREVRNSAQALRAGELRGRWDALKGSNPRLRPVLEGLERRVTSGAILEGDGQAGDRPAEGGGGRNGGGPSRLLSAPFRAGMEFLITLFALFFFYRDADRVTAALRGLLPMSSSDARRTLRRVGDAVWATTYGTLVVSLVQGTLGGLMFWFLGLPAPILWGFVMTVLALVPMLGAFLVWLPAAVFLALEGSPGKAIILAVWGAVVIGTVDNLLYPHLVGNRMRLHTLVVFLSMLGGLSLFGASGLFLGPAIVSFALELRRIWTRQRRRSAPAAA